MCFCGPSRPAGLVGRHRLGSAWQLVTEASNVLPTAQVQPVCPQVREMLSVTESLIAPGLGFLCLLGTNEIPRTLEKAPRCMSVSPAGEECRPS